MVEAVRQKAGADRTQRSSGESASDSEATGGRAEYVGRETGRSIDVVGERS